MDRPSPNRTAGTDRATQSRPSAARRTFLRSAGATTLGLVAGCLESSPASTFDHPAAAGLGTQPWLGDRDPEAGRIVVVFEDPSCPVCRIFEERTFPELRGSLVEPGRAAFVSRGYPVAADWGEPGLEVLEAAYARDENAFWELRAFLYAEQGRTVFSTETLHARTREFFSSEASSTDVDPEAVLRDAENDRYGAAVERDVEAARDAGVRGTPTFFLFEDGEYLTKIEGAPSYDLLVNTMGIDP